MNNRYNTLFRAINFIVDYLILNLSMICIYLLIDTSSLFWARNRYIPVVLFFNLLWFFSSSITGLYEYVLVKNAVKTYGVVIKSYFLFLSLISIANLLVISNKGYFVTGEFLFYSVALFGLLLCFWKLIFLSLRKSERTSLIGKRTFVILGGGRVAHALHHFLEINDESGYRLMGIFDDDPEAAKNFPNYKGSIKECLPYALANNINEIFCSLPSSEAECIQDIMLKADRNLIRFKFVPEYFDFAKRPTMVENFGHIPIISARPEPLENMLNRFIKRFFDCTFSCFVIIFILSWLYPLLALLIKSGSRGPVLFVQVRSGRDNKPFKCYKFRSMVVNTNSHEKQATKNDPRVTKLGIFLRRTSIDELPQFFNVLIGNMSVVGPRPHMLNHTKQYSELIDKFMVRHFLKPGITGFAQVNGLRGETKTTHAMLLRVEADVWYLENWSFLLDMKIVFLTIWNAIKGEKNAY